jgi:hypothetical protein
MPQVSAVFRGFFIRIGCFHQPQERMPLRGVVTWVTCEGLQWKQFSGTHLSDLTFQDGCSLIYSVLPLLTLIGLLLLTWRFRNSARLDQYIIFYDQRLVARTSHPIQNLPFKISLQSFRSQICPAGFFILGKKVPFGRCFGTLGVEL